MGEGARGRGPLPPPPNPLPQPRKNFSRGRRSLRLQLPRPGKAQWHRPPACALKRERPCRGGSRAAPTFTSLRSPVRFQPLQALLQGADHLLVLQEHTQKHGFQGPGVRGIDPGLEVQPGQLKEAVELRLVLPPAGPGGTSASAAAPLPKRGYKVKPCVPWLVASSQFPVVSSSRLSNTQLTTWLLSSITPAAAGAPRWPGSAPRWPGIW